MQGQFSRALRPRGTATGSCEQVIAPSECLRYRRQFGTSKDRR